MIKSKDNYLSSLEVANILGFTADHVRKLLLQGKIKGEKFGRNWIIDVKNVSKVTRKRFPRPAKESLSNGTCSKRKLKNSL